MQKLNLVKAIVRYNPFNFSHNFVQGKISKAGSERYLLLQKAIDTYFPKNIGKWEFVGGMIKPKETSIETITREMTEETGLKIGRNARIIKQLPTLESNESVCDVYLLETSSMDVKLSSEHSDYMWVRAENVRNMDLVLYASLLLEFFNNSEKYLS